MFFVYFSERGGREGTFIGAKRQSLLMLKYRMFVSSTSLWVWVWVWVGTKKNKKNERGNKHKICEDWEMFSNFSCFWKWKMFDPIKQHTLPKD